MQRTPSAFLTLLLILTITACLPLTRKKANELISANKDIAAPIIAAIEKYQSDNSEYPEDLLLLVPEYLTEIPEPITHSEFDYYIDDLSGGYLLGFRVEKNSGCGYTPRFGWDCGFGH